MAAAELRWTPAPYRAAFTITDDTDAAELPAVRAVYDRLAALELPVTKTVWAFKPVEPCGIPAIPNSIQRGVTLEDPEYLAYCRGLAERGFEITLHGATAGNNRREVIQRAWALMDQHFPRARVYICHAKNADNPYWQGKTVARGPMHALLAFYSRGHKCSGEDPASPYFWGDLCRERGLYIRLLRTRTIDTLAANPSMPYFETEKPLVRGWFSATKRSFRDCTAPEALAALERDWGACMLYQYISRYADPATGRPTRDFEAGTQRLADSPRVWVDTAGALLDRMRLIQGVYIAARDRDLWVVNTNAEEVQALQILVPYAPVAHEWVGAAHDAPGWRNGVLVAPRVAGGRLLRLTFDRPMTVTGRNAVALDAQGVGRADFGHGTVRINLGAQEARGEGSRPLPPHSFELRFRPGLEALAPRSRASDFELTRLAAEQASIIAREVLFKGRKLDTKRWLGSETIALENHDTW